MKPTEEQIKEFWERCGDVPHRTIKYTGHQLEPVEEEIYPSINLNSLFKYALPKIEDLRWIKFDTVGNCELRVGNRAVFNQPIKSRVAPILALFWAIKRVLDETQSGN